MDHQNFSENHDSMSVDEIIRSAKKELREEPAPVPDEYADFSAEDDEYDDEYEDNVPRGMPAILRMLLYVSCVLLASVLLAVFAWKALDDVCALTAREQTVTVTVPENATIAQVTDILHDAGLVEYKPLFSLYCMVSNAEQKINPGTYALNTVYDYHALVNGMISSSKERATVMVTVPEGYELSRIFSLLEEKGVCSVEALEEAAANYDFDYAFLQALEKGDARRLEGYLFPDTYEFWVDDDAPRVLNKFLKNFDNRATELIGQELEALNARLRASMEKNGFTEEEIQKAALTFHDVVIVASLVEKETSRTSESGTIASVIYNRLCSKLYPCLNIDATIQYVLPERKEILTNADKSVLSPYNTYRNAGLPVGPISNPGMASIRAALYPADTNYYFYAIDPEGGHHFSESSYDHQQYLDLLSGKALQEEEARRQAEEAAKAEAEENQAEEADNGG